METKQSPLVVIIGPTASGKSALALEIARRYDGEIISADSRTIYKGMDVGTAKPSATERDEIPHHLFDIILPNETFSAAEFKRQALLLIDDITSRGRLPIMAGGTGLYVDGVIFDFAFLPPVPPEERAELEAMSTEQLQNEITSRGLSMPENHQNRRYLIRALETNGAVPIRKGLRQNTLVIGLDISREELKKRLKARVDKMISDGFIEEVKNLVEQYGWDAPGMSAPGYKAFRPYIEGDINIDEAKQRFVQNDFNLAKRQRTWFKRNPYIKWIQKTSEADKFIKEFLQK
jgi:tRNA dimethylallyltransferase